MTDVGAAAEPLGGVAESLGRLGDEAGVRRARIAALLQEAGETTSTVPTLAHLEHWADTSAADARQAAEIAAADATACLPSAPAQTGLRASMGLIDDVAFELLFVNDVSRLIFGRDINTGTGVGPGGRAVSALGLIPFGKLAKLGKLAAVADEGAEVAAAAPRIITPAARSLDDVESLRGATVDEVRALVPEGWVEGPVRKGRGTRWLPPDGKGDAIMVEMGWPNPRDLVHAGPYVRISKNGSVTRTPLAGNPMLENP